jgi:hypothetical protein
METDFLLYFAFTLQALVRNFILMDMSEVILNSVARRKEESPLQYRR